MSEPESPSQPCYSMRLVQPFLEVMRRNAAIPAEMLEPLEAMDADDRLPISVVHELLEGGIALTGDPDIGLRAAQALQPGDFGALEYAAGSAANYGGAIEVIGRFMRLVNDALSFRLEVEGDQAQVQLESSIVLPRAAADFQSAAFHAAESFRRPPMDIRFEVWFAHARPERTEEYERTFAPGSVHFGAPFNGFSFPASYLEVALPTADPKLHQVIRQHAEVLLAELPRAESVTEKVRDLLAAELSGGNPMVECIAQRLHMSPRTLGRKLEHEGTTFKELLDDLRKRLALRYVGGHDLGLAEIAFLLGFSRAAAFHRAFKRWTGQTPIEYRRARRG